MCTKILQDWKNSLEINLDDVWDWRWVPEGISYQADKDSARELIKAPFKIHIISLPPWAVFRDTPVCYECGGTCYIGSTAMTEGEAKEAAREFVVTLQEEGLI